APSLQHPHPDPPPSRGREIESRRRGIWMEGDSIDLGFSVVDAYTGRIEAFADHVREHTRGNGRLLVVTQQAARLRELMEDRDLYPAAGLFVARQTELVPNLIVLGNQPVAQGFAIRG